jgi:23S rRNA (adenine2503-C2)-methyltransferase
MLPLEEKWVITISTQYGCSMNCKFCDVPKVGPGRNATVLDMYMQVEAALNLHPEVKNSKRVNVHFARMGEPTLNFDVIPAARAIKQLIEGRGHKYHPVVSTMMPRKNAQLENFISEWLQFKNETMDGEAGLQLSIQSTSYGARNYLFSNNAAYLTDISRLMTSLLEYRGLKGRKIALNFAIDDQSNIYGQDLRMFFDPKYFMCKITPMHMTESCKNIRSEICNGYSSFHPYACAERELKRNGFDVIVFVPSKEEDESMITCGNAILAHRNDE